MSGSVALTAADPLSALLDAASKRRDAKSGKRRIAQGAAGVGVVLTAALIASEAAARADEAEEGAALPVVPVANDLEDILAAADLCLSPAEVASRRHDHDAAGLFDYADGPSYLVSRLAGDAGAHHGATSSDATPQTVDHGHETGLPIFARHHVAAGHDGHDAADGATPVEALLRVLGEEASTWSDASAAASAHDMHAAMRTEASHDELPPALPIL